MRKLHRGLPRTSKTLWALEVRASLERIRDYYYADITRSQLSEELVNEFRNCSAHYFELWDIAISKIDDAIKLCKQEKKWNYMLSDLQRAKRNMELRRIVPSDKGVDYLISSLKI